MKYLCVLEIQGKPVAPKLFATEPTENDLVGWLATTSYASRREAIRIYEVDKVGKPYTQPLNISWEKI